MTHVALYLIWGLGQLGALPVAIWLYRSRRGWFVDRCAHNLSWCISASVEKLKSGWLGLADGDFNVQVMKHILIVYLVIGPIVLASRIAGAEIRTKHSPRGSAAFGGFQSGRLPSGPIR